jgi:PH/SEC7 domain-containing protein
MNAFIPPPVPVLPTEHRSPVTSPIADVFSTSPRVGDAKKGLPSRKPLPPIIGHSPSSYREGEGVDRSMVFVEKKTALPPLPPPSPSTSTPIAMKRRSASVSGADTGSPILQTPANSPNLPKTPNNRRVSNDHHSRDNTLHGILDVFNGELSTLDPFSGASLELKDPSTPSRQLSSQTTHPDGLFLSSRDIQGNRLENKKAASPPSLSLDPFITAGSHSETDLEPAVTAPSAIVPPRSSSLNTPARYSIGSPAHASSSRQLNNTPLRSRSGPPATLVVQSQNNSGNRLRVLHRSTASSSEPSLIPPPDDASSSRVCEPVVPFIQVESLLNARTSLVASPRTTSQQDLVSPESTHFRSSPTPIITGDDSEDMETRGKDLASRCWNENEDFLAKEKIAEWLGG